jgi:Zn-dependent protease
MEPPNPLLEAPPPLQPAPTPVEPPLAEPQSRRSWLREKLGAAGAALLALLAKLKAILLLLPKVKLLATAGTMGVSLVAYASIWGFGFGAGFVALLLLHELGHVIQLRRQGIRASAPIFIPFLGAVIGARSLGDDALAEAKVGLAGPILGSIAAAACIPIWHATGNDLWRALAYTGFLINLFNLIPVVPLDGGRAMAAMSPWMWVVGFGALVVLAVLAPNPIFVLILVLGAFEAYRRWQQYRHGAVGSYYRVPPLDRALIAGVYIGLIALLVLGMQATNLPRSIV